MKRLLLAFLLLLPLRLDAARLFTASNSDVIVVPTITTWTNNFSVSAWIYLASSPGSGSGYCITSNSNGAGALMFNVVYYNDGSPYILFFQWNTSFNNYVQYTKAITLTTGVWYHICWTIDLTTNPDTIQLYVNGTAQNPTQSLGGNNTSGPYTGGTARVGCRYFGSNDWFWDGRLDKVALFNTTLNAGQALALARGAQFDRMEPPASYEAAWDLSGWRTTELDVSNNRRNSTTITGTAAATGPPTVPR